MDAALVGLDHEAGPRGQAADGEHHGEGAQGGDYRHHPVRPERGHDLSRLRLGCATGHP